MANVSKYTSNSIKVQHIHKDELSTFNKINDAHTHPIVGFNNILKRIRSHSKNTKNLSDEMSIVESLKSELLKFANENDIPVSNFNIDTSGEPIVISERNGQHYILPTHFEVGAYLSSPHFDHELNYSTEQIPHIHIGKYTRLGKGASINAGSNIYIGDFVWLAPGSVLLRQEHSAYGQPSVAARTIAMTNQPEIHVSDFSWVGREAIVGWNCDYIGKASIVGSRSFINKWVGDYSIVGDHSKILGYLPYKSYFFNKYKPSYMDILKINDWQQVYDDWQKEYEQINNGYKSDLVLEEIARDIISKKDGTLVLDIENPLDVQSLFYGRLDVFTTEETKEAYMLESAQRAGFNNLRTRVIDELDKKIPADTAKNKLGRVSGYKLVVLGLNSTNLNIKSDELERILQDSGYLLVANRLIDSISDKFVMIKNVMINDKDFILLQKKAVEK